MLSNQLDLLNVPAAELAWVPPGTSFIDVTLAGDEVFPHLQNWKYLDFHSLSDHPYIYFTIAGHHHPSRPIQLLIPNIEYVDLGQVSRNLQNSLQPLPNLSSIEAVDASVLHLTTCIRQSLLFGRLPRNYQRRRNLWWTASLCSLRTRLRRAFKMAGLTRSTKSLHHCAVLKAEYQREIRKAKAASWKRFCTEALNADPFSALRQVSRTNSCPPSIFSMKSPNGSSTTDVSEILSILAEALIPSADNGEEIGEIIASVMSQVDSYLPPPITASEISTSNA